MIGSFITRALVLILGYAYPAYECFKTVEMNKPDIEQLRFWCQYWILVAMLTVCERIGDMFVSWVPMYGEAKLAFFIYLWFPKTKGTIYVYDSFFRPYISKHETDIDRNLIELRTRAGDMVLLYCRKAVSYSQTRVFDILQYIDSQSNPPRPSQTQQGARVQKAVAPTNRRSTATTQLLNKQPSPTSAEIQENAANEAGPSELPKSTPAPDEQKTVTPVEWSKTSDSNEEQVDLVTPATEEAQPTLQDTVMEEAGRVTRARAKKTHALLIKC